jgi:hypothetical protein
MAQLRLQLILDSGLNLQINKTVTKLSLSRITESYSSVLIQQTEWYCLQGFDVC